MTEKWLYEVKKLAKLRDEIQDCVKKANELGLNDIGAVKRSNFLAYCKNFKETQGRMPTDLEIDSSGYKPVRDSKETVQLMKDISKESNEIWNSKYNLLASEYCNPQRKSLNPYIDYILQRLPIINTKEGLDKLNSEVLNAEDIDKDDYVILSDIIDLKIIELMSKNLKEK